jgi:hypothetical protein
MKPRPLTKEMHDLFAEASYLGPRTLSQPEDYESQDDSFCEESALEGILDLLKCPICLEVLD